MVQIRVQLRRIRKEPQFQYQYEQDHTKEERTKVDEVHVLSIFILFYPPRPQTPAGSPALMKHHRRPATFVSRMSILSKTGPSSLWHVGRENIPSSSVLESAVSVHHWRRSTDPTSSYRKPSTGRRAPSSATPLPPPKSMAKDDRKLLYNPQPDRQNRSRGKSHRIHRRRRSDERQEKSRRRLFHHAWGSSNPAPLRRTSRGTHTSPEDHQGPPGAKEAAMDPSSP